MASEPVEGLTHKRRMHMRHFVIVAVLVIAMSVLTYTGLTASGLMPVKSLRCHFCSHSSLCHCSIA